MAIRKKKPKKALSPLRRKIRMVCKLLVLAILSVLVIGMAIFYIKYGRDIFRLQSEAKTLVKDSSEESFRQNLTTQVYDSEGKLICKLKSEKDTYYVKIGSIPQQVTDAVVSIEDKKFYTHSGVDYLANVRAAMDIIKHKGKITQGASTITQQLARNIFLSHEVSWERKVEEIFIAVELEKRYSKTKILEYYLNNIYFANGYYGIQAASKGYFSKDVSKLSLSQIAFLIAIPNNPTLYDPIENKDNVIKRRDRILAEMLADGKITNDQYNEAVIEKITLKQTTLEKQDYITTYVKYAATEALMEASGFVFQNQFEEGADREAYVESYRQEYDRCQQMLFTKGYTIKTSIDSKKQQELQKALDDGLKNFTSVNKEGTYEMQGSSACIDNNTGRVVAIVGGRSQETEGYTLNRAYQSYRQPGSSIKPLIDYLPALQGGYTPSSKVVDEEVKDGVKNSDRRYLGALTLRRALELSRNTIAYKLFQEFNPILCMDNLYKMDFHKLTEEDYLATASIGGMTYGVSAVEMAAAYSTIENDGKYRKPTCIVSILDVDQNTVVGDDITEKPIYDKEACYAMTDMLEGVLIRGTGRGYSLTNMPSAGKTGTTNSNHDGWFVGYTPYYTTSVWVGFDIPREIRGLEGGTYPLQIWNHFMNNIHKGLKRIDFPTYNDPGKVNPSANDKITETPKVTHTTKATKTPNVTMKPEKTKEPVPTKSPVATKKPEATKTPKPTEVTPDVTPSPEEDNSEVDDEIDIEDFFSGEEE